MRPARRRPSLPPSFQKIGTICSNSPQAGCGSRPPSGSDTTTGEPTTDLATARAACLWSCQGGVGSPESRGDGVALKRSPFLLDMKGLRCRTLCLPTCTCQRKGEKNAPSDNKLRENERNQRRRRPISRCSCEVIFTSYFPEGALKRHHRRRRRERPRYLLITGRQESAPLLGGERARMQVG